MDRSGIRAGLRAALAPMGFMAGLLAACSSPSTPQYQTLNIEATPLAVAPRLYNSAAWLDGDQIALAFLAPTTGITLVASSGEEHGALGMPDVADCRAREFRALARTADGRLSYAEACDTVLGVRVDFVAYDVGSGQKAPLGGGSGMPFDASWSPDREMIYSTGDVLCASLYRRLPAADEPLPLAVEVGGQAFRAGQDIDSAPDGCPRAGRAAFPAYSLDSEHLAFMASSDGGGDGQDLLDRPWTIFVVREGTPVSILSDVTDPRDMAWVDGDRLLIAAHIHGRAGLWSMSADGSGMTLLSDIDALDLFVDPAGRTAGAILSGGGVPDDSDVVLLELPPS